MNGLTALFWREFASYFRTPVAAVVLVAFVTAAGVVPFWLGGFFERGQADLRSAFAFHPWLYLVFVPAIAMRLWAEDRRTGTTELLATLPITRSAAILGKFLAGWAFIGLALVLTMPIWVAITWLGAPDHGVVLAGYLGSLLLAGAYLAIGSAASAATDSQVVAFVVAVGLGLVLTVPGAPLVVGTLGGLVPVWLVEGLAGLSLLSRFEAIHRGVLDFRDIVYFLSTIGLFLTITHAVLEAETA